MIDRDASVFDPLIVDNNDLWFIVPAAGIGQRMGANVPKQYLSFADSTIIETTLTTLLNVTSLAGIVVAIHPNDVYWASLSISQHDKIHTVIGGDARADSVFAALVFLQHRINPRQWVLVHDAARPCVSVSSIEKMISELANNDVGGILGVNSSDTLKRVDAQKKIEETIEREKIWQAQTPQMFRYGLLFAALAQALERKMAITDESSAMELAGHPVNMVTGRRDNIKITHADDLYVAEAIYKQHNNR